MFRLRHGGGHIFGNNGEDIFFKPIQEEGVFLLYLTQTILPMPLMDVIRDMSGSCLAKIGSNLDSSIMIVGY